MINIKSPAEIALMREAGAVLASIFDEVGKHVAEGITTRELDRIAESLMRSKKATACCKGYHGYPAAICTSVNNELIHGIPSSRRLADGDIISLDISIGYKGFHSDATRTYLIGNVDEQAQRLVEAAREAFFKGVELIRPDERLGTIGNAIQRHVESQGYSVVRDFVGHGIGRELHEEPSVPNWGRAGSGARLAAGMTLAVEPMICMGAPDVEILPDNWTVVSRDRKLTAHYENTVLITQDGVEILTLQG